MEERYTNDKIRDLMKKRDESNSYYNSEIRKEYEKEKAKYKFNWPAFLFLVGGIIIGSFSLYYNHKLFPATSIWSWDYKGYWWN